MRWKGKIPKEKKLSGVTTATHSSDTKDNVTSTSGTALEVQGLSTVFKMKTLSAMKTILNIKMIFLLPWLENSKPRLVTFRG